MSDVADAVRRGWDEARWWSRLGAVWVGAVSAAAFGLVVWSVATTRDWTVGRAFKAVGGIYLSGVFGATVPMAILSRPHDLGGYGGC